MNIRKKLTLLALAGCALGAAHSAMAQTSVGVSIGINEPGVYGRINIGNYPAPVLFNPQPVIIAPPAVAVVREPIYLYVPEEHRLHWAKYCGRYSACGQPVHFVQERWVREQWEREHEHDRGRHRGWEKKEDRDHDRDHDRGRDERRHD
jgi:hypothetical protein